MTRRRALAAILVCASMSFVASLAGCRGGGDPVRANLDAVVKAANARDAGACAKLLASGFQAADGSSRADAEETLKRYFSAYEILDVRISDVVIERGEGAARVRLRATMSGQPRRIGGLEGLVPSSAAYDFDLRLVLEDGVWKLSWAQWNPTGASGRNS